ncbi:MAG TPA: DUF6265 family protein [Paucimonas sp.]|nr:DUF6265 family protein [Paucimonas sp.]
MRISTATTAALAGLGLALFALPTAYAESIRDLHWLTGCWASERAEPGSEEHWMPPAGGMMIGASRTIRGGKAVEYEFIVIREIAPGKLGYVAHPSNQKPAVFPLLKVGANEAVFENPEHDFPQRILYRLEGDALRARIEGMSKGQLKGIDFPMKRVGCDAAAVRVKE